MSLLDAYLPALGESVTWRSRTGVDQYGDPSYSDSTISVIWFDQKRVIHQEGREDVVCDAFCLTESDVLQGDAITRGGTTWPVLDVGTTPGFGGHQFHVVNMSKNQA